MKTIPSGNKNLRQYQPKLEQDQSANLVIVSSTKHSFHQRVFRLFNQIKIKLYQLIHYAWVCFFQA